MSKRFYSKASTSEPNMRSEFNWTMDGVSPEVAKAQILVFRKMQRSLIDPIITDPKDPLYDSKKIRLFHARAQIPDHFVPNQGYLIPCSCISTSTGEQDIDSWCPICQGDFYLWEETFIDGYKVQLSSDVGKAVNNKLTATGLNNLPLMIFYTRSSVPITRADKIVEIWTNEEGEAIRPYLRKSLYRIVTPIDYRSDHGKLEYWKLDCHEEQRKFLNGPKG